MLGLTGLMVEGDPIRGVEPCSRPEPRTSAWCGPGLDWWFCGGAGRGSARETDPTITAKPKKTPTCSVECSRLRLGFTPLASPRRSAAKTPRREKTWPKTRAPERLGGPPWCTGAEDLPWRGSEWRSAAAGGKMEATSQSLLLAPEGADRAEEGGLCERGGRLAEASGRGRERGRGREGEPLLAGWLAGWLRY